MCLLLASAALWMSACSEECRDADGDGRGEGCELGPDCDDADPRRSLRCIDIPARCVAQPKDVGCPCLDELDNTCYTGAPETLGVGVCRLGVAECRKGLFLACRDQTLPSGESCNDLDDDCDGRTDERVASPCGGCDPTCVGAVWGPPVEPFVAGEGTSLTAAGELTLARVSRDRQFVWVPNTDEGTLSKIDVEAAAEIARYRTPGRRPVRVAVDHRGDVWVLDSPRDARARLGKLSWELSRCVDRDGDGLETSLRPDQVLDLDECWLLDVPLGEAGDGASALAIDGAQAPDSELAGNAWVGFSSAERVVSFDGTTGKQLTAADTPGFAAYAGAFDLWGQLWMIDREGLLARVDPLGTPPEVELLAVELACYTLEGLALEPDGSLLFPGFGCENVAAFDPQSARWRDVRVPGLFSPRGIAITAAAPWVVYTSGQLARVDREPLVVSQAYELGAADLVPFESVAVAADSFGQLWVVSTQGGPEGRGLATRFDPTSTLVTAQVVVGLGPRGGGDLTGLALGSEFVREAAVDHIFEGSCDADEAMSSGTLWKALHLDAEVGVGGTVELAVRWADSRENLGAREFSLVGRFPMDGESFPLQLPDGGVLEVRVTLRSSYATGAPRIRRVGAEWACAGPG